MNARTTGRTCPGGGRDCLCCDPGPRRPRHSKAARRTAKRRERQSWRREIDD